MAEIEGVWQPETEAELAFIEAVNRHAQDAYEDGVDQADLAAGLSFLAATVAMHDPGESPDPSPPEPPERRETCPKCGTTIEDAQAFVGGDAIVDPCGCGVTVDEIPGWIEGVDDDA